MLFRGCRLSPRKTVPHDRTDSLECVHASDNVRESRAARPSCPKTRPPPTVGTGLEAWFPGKSDGPPDFIVGYIVGMIRRSWKILDRSIRQFARNRIVDQKADDRSRARSSSLEKNLFIYLFTG